MNILKSDGSQVLTDDPHNLLVRFRDALLLDEPVELGKAVLQVLQSVVGFRTVDTVAGFLRRASILRLVREEDESKVQRRAVRRLYHGGRVLATGAELLPRRRCPTFIRVVAGGGQYGWARRGRATALTAHLYSALTVVRPNPRGQGDSAAFSTLSPARLATHQSLRRQNGSVKQTFKAFTFISTSQ